MKEAFLEPILRRMRIKKVLPTIYRYPGCRLLDIGCGSEYSLLKSVEPFIGSGVGIDFKVREMENTKIKTMRMRMTDSLPFESETFDIVTMLAVLEHLADPLRMMSETERVLKRGGRVVLTVPSMIAKPVLEFLAYRLHIVSEVEMKDHKQYFNRGNLSELLSQSGMTIERHRYFQLGMNNYCVAMKTTPMDRKQ